MAVTPAVAMGSMMVSSTMAVAGTFLDTYQQRKQADAMEAQQEKANQQAVENAVAQYGDLGTNAGVAQKNAIESALENQMSALKAEGAVAAEAAASATGGGVIDAALSDINQQKGRNLSTIIENKELNMRNIAVQAENVRQGGIANQDLSIISKPSWITAGINMATQATQGLTSVGMAQNTFNQAQLASGGV